MLLNYLLNPITPKAFFSDYFEKEILHVSRNNSLEYFDSIVTLQDVEDFLRKKNAIYSPHATVNKTHQKYLFTQWHNRTSLISNIPRMIDAFLLEDKTIILESLDENIVKLNHFIQELTLELPCTLSCNSYISPPNSQGLDIHYDDHDVIILQFHGSKNWFFYDKPVELPGYGSERTPLPNYDEVEPSLTLTLLPGDTLYIPRGQTHCASTGQSSAAHITLAITNTVRGEELINALAKEVEQDAFFRRTASHLSETELEEYAFEFKQKLQQKIEQLSLPTLISNLTKKQQYKKLGHLEKPLLTTALNIENINETTKFQKHKFTNSEVKADGIFIILQINHHIYKYPCTMLPIIEEILNKQCIASKDIQSSLNIDNLKALELLKKWVQIGLLTILVD